MPQRGKMDARISCTPEVQKALRFIASGAGVNYDELLRYLLDSAGLDVYEDEVAGRMAGIERIKEMSKFKADDDE